MDGWIMLAVGAVFLVGAVTVGEWLLQVIVAIAETIATVFAYALVAIITFVLILYFLGAVV